MVKKANLLVTCAVTAAALTPSPSAASSSSASLSSPLSPLHIPRGGWQRRGGGGGPGSYSPPSTKHYDTLGVPSTATQKEITKAYRRLCVRHHPDKNGGDRKKFDEISEAYGVLGDEEKRRQYDEFGDAGPRMGAGGNPFAGAGFGGMSGMSQDDILRAFFSQQAGGGGSSFSFNNFRRPPPRYNLTLSLSDLYKGATKSVTIAVPTPRGSERQTMTVRIPRGVAEGSVMEVGGVEFVVKEGDDGGFKRSGNDLMITVRINLTECLTGVERTFTHLDGRSVRVRSNGPVRHGAVMVVRDEGMPVRGGGEGKFGRMFVKWHVEAPEVENERREEVARFFGESVEELRGKGKAGVKGREADFGKDRRGCEREGEGRRASEDDFFYRGNGFGPRFEGGGTQAQCAQM